MLKENVQFHGLGQCGSKLGMLFSSFGYRVDYYNSDIVDVRNTGIPKNDLLLVTTSGTGRSTIKGKEIMHDHLEAFEKFLVKRMEKGKMQIFLVGLGGGTGGSSIETAIEIAKEQGFKIGVIATLPQTMSGMLAMGNAISTLKALKAKENDIHMFIVADNQYLSETIGLGEEWWHEINNCIISNVVSVFNLLREDKISHSGIGSIDRAEILRVLQYGKGFADIREISFSVDEVNSISEEELKVKLFKACFVEGYNYKNTLAYLVSIDMPTKGVYTNFSSKVFDITKNVCGSSISLLGMFIDPTLTDTIRVTIVNSGLKLPNILKSRMNNLKRDAERHSAKKNKTDGLDFSSVDDVNLDEDFEF